SITTNPSYPNDFSLTGAEIFEAQQGTSLAHTTETKTRFINREYIAFSALLDSVVTQTRVERLLSKLVAKSPVLDAIPIWVWKKCSYELAEALTVIFRRSLLTGEIAQEWRHATLTPIPKIDSPLLPSDYRPISQTAVPSKILEKIICSSFLSASIIPSVYK